MIVDVVGLRCFAVRSGTSDGVNLSIGHADSELSTDDGSTHALEILDTYRPTVSLWLSCSYVLPDSVCRPLFRVVVDRCHRQWLS